MDRKTYQMKLTRDIAYVAEAGNPLMGTLYAPESPVRCPVVVAIHGGGWDQGSRTTYGHWGPIFAEHGVALFAIDRRRFGAGEPAFPGVIEDLRAAVKYIRSDAKSLNIDPDRIAVMGDSTGGYVAAATGLLGDSPLPGEQAANYSVSCVTKCVIAVYGVFDLSAEWNFEQIARPFDRTAEKLMGVPLIDDRVGYFKASPIAYATRDRNRLSFFLAWGTHDDVVSEHLHSVPFARALSQANFNVQTCILPGAQHYWLTEPIAEVGSRSGLLAPRLLRFLDDCL